jgi:hypothetical protein
MEAGRGGGSLHPNAENASTQARDGVTAGSFMGAVSPRLESRTEFSPTIISEANGVHVPLPGRPERAPPALFSLLGFTFDGVSDGDRTRDNRSHNPVLYH